MAIAIRIGEHEFRRLALEDGDVRWELDHGTLLENPGLSVAHGRMVSDLSVLLSNQV